MGEKRSSEARMLQNHLIQIHSQFTWNAGIKRQKKEEEEEEKNHVRIRCSALCAFPQDGTPKKRAEINKWKWMDAQCALRMPATILVVPSNEYDKC